MLQEMKLNSSSTETGVELFYHILSLLNEEINSYPPTKQFYLSCLEKLGQVSLILEFRNRHLSNINFFIFRALFAELNTKLLDY